MFFKIIRSKIMCVLLVGAILNLVFQGCILSPDGKKEQKSDIILSGSDAQIASVAKAQWPMIEYLANNPGKEKVVEFISDSGKKIFLAISSQKGDDGRFVKVRDIETGRSVRISFVRDGVSPALNFLYNDGQSFTYKVFNGANKTGETTLASLFTAGLAVAGVGLAVWLGASVGKFIIATVAFLAFNLMMLGVVIAAGAFAISFFKTMGWDSEVIINFLKAVFENVVEEVRYIIQTTADILDPFLPKKPRNFGALLNKIKDGPNILVRFFGCFAQIEFRYSIRALVDGLFSGFLSTLTSPSLGEGDGFNPSCSSLVFSLPRFFFGMFITSFLFYILHMPCENGRPLW